MIILEFLLLNALLVYMVLLEAHSTVNRTFKKSKIGYYSIHYWTIH